MTTTETAPAKGEKTDLGKLPLKGGSKGKLKSLDGKETIGSDPDPKVVPVAEKLAQLLDEAKTKNSEAEVVAGELLAAFRTSKKARRIKVVTKAGQVYHFSLESLTKLKKERIN